MTVIEQPSAIVSAYAPVIIDAYDTAATALNGRCKATVQRQSNADGRWVDVGSKIQPMYRNTRVFRFDVSELLRRDLTHDYPSQSGSNVIIGENNSCAFYRVALAHYESGVLQTTTYSDTFTAVNTVPDTRTDTDLTPYIIVDGSTNEFLTTQKTQRLRDGEHLQFHFLWNETQVGTKAVMRSYPLSGSPSNSDITIKPFDLLSYLFIGNFTDPLSASPTPTFVNGILDQVTGTDGKEYVGFYVEDTSSYIEVTASIVGKKILFEVFMQDAGNILITWVGASATQTYAAPVGWSQFESNAVPASTTAIRVENKSAQFSWFSWIKVVDEDSTDIPVNRGILYLDEYDPTLEKVELWLENDSVQVSETLTVFMDGCSNGKRLAWLSGRGTMEHYTFTKENTEEKVVEKNRVLTETVEPTGEQRGLISSFSLSTDQTTVYTRFETPETMAWLSEIIESPEVYLVNAYNDRVPVDVITATFPKGGTRLRQGSITFRPTYTNTIQNG